MSGSIAGAVLGIPYGDIAVDKGFPSLGDTMESGLDQHQRDDAERRQHRPDDDEQACGGRARRRQPVGG